MLAATAGVPLVVLSATSPLLQDWLGRRGHPTPYWLFAVSNFASLAALLVYPFGIEPALNLSRQSVWWSILFVFFASLCALVAWQSRTSPALASLAVEWLAPVFQPLYWFLLAAAGSMLLLSITNHIAANVAAVP